MSSPVRFDAWQFRKPVVVTERNRSKITLPAFSANCGSSLFGKSVYFNGAYGGSAFGSDPTSTTELSVEFWVNTAGQQVGIYYPVVSFNHQIVTPFHPKYEIGVLDRKVYCWFRKSAVVTPVVSVGTVSLYVWTHVAVMWNGTDVKIYIDGVLDSTTALASPVDTPVSSGFRLGHTRFTSPEGVFIGGICELRIWDAVRTLDQIVNNRFTPRNTTNGLETEDLLYYFKLGDIVSSTLVRDYVGAGADVACISPSSASNNISDGPPLKYGASFVAAQWPITLTKKSSIKFPVIPPTNTTFALIVRWTDDNNVVQRRFLWTVSGVDISPIPVLYQGEALPTSFVLEAWNIDGRETISLPSALTIYTSLTSLPLTDVDHESQVAVDPVIDTTLAANFPLTPFPLVFNTQQVYPS